MRPIHAIITLLFLPLAVLHTVFRASLPALEGRVHVTGLSQPVRIERDALGIPTITAATRADLAFGTGFVHGDTPSSLVQAPSCWIDQDGRAVGSHVIHCSGSVSPNYAVTYRDGSLTVRRRPCADGTVCASDDPPTIAEQRRLRLSGFVCALAIPSSDRRRLLRFRNLRPGVIATVWRASVT